MKQDRVIAYLQTAKLLRLARETGIARSTLQRLKHGQSKRMTIGTRRLIESVMDRK